nr:reverse transcriptase domain-containing protein [Tanacetum cinerariifolium]
MEEWTLFADGASSLKRAGAGLVLIDPTGTEYTYAIRLNFASTNNEAKYEVLLAGLRIEEKMKVRDIKVKVDSKFVAYQLNGEFVASSEGMAKCLAKAKELSEVLVEVLNTKSVDIKEVSTIVEEEEDNWMTSIIRCLEEGISLEDENEARTLRMKISQYTLVEGIWLTKGNHDRQQNASGNDPFKGWCKKLKIKKMNTTVAHPQANGLVERANKSLMHGLKARLGRERVG